MGFYMIVDDYYEYGLAGLDMLPIVGEAVSTILLFAGIVVFSIFLLPFFVIGVVCRPDTLKKRDKRIKKYGGKEVNEEDAKARWELGDY